MAGAFSIAGLALPTTAQAATMAVDQCNGHGPGAAGATTAMKCTVTVVNTISGTTTYSTTTVTRLCTLGPCSSPNGTFVTDSVSLVTVIRQCNGSDNDAAHAINCYVNVINNIGRNTPDAKPLTAPDGQPVRGLRHRRRRVLDCTPSPATGTTVTQCNGSGNGGGGTVHCTVDPQSRVSRAIPITVNQCNGTGNPGGSGGPATPASSPGSPTSRPVAVPKATSTPTTTATPTGDPPDPTPVIRAHRLPPRSSASNRSTGGSDHGGLLMLGAGLVLAAAVGALLYRRYAPNGPSCATTRV